jgi:hypothetical protein
VPTYLIIFFQAFVYLISSVIYMLIWKRTEIGIDLQKYKNYIPFLIIVPFFSAFSCSLQLPNFFKITDRLLI